MAIHDALEFPADELISGHPFIRVISGKVFAFCLRAPRFSSVLLQVKVILVRK